MTIAVTATNPAAAAATLYTGRTDNVLLVRIANSGSPLALKAGPVVPESKAADATTTLLFIGIDLGPQLSADQAAGLHVSCVGWTEPQYLDGWWSLAPAADGSLAGAPVEVRIEGWPAFAQATTGQLQVEYFNFGPVVDVSQPVVSIQAPPGAAGRTLPVELGFGISADGSTVTDRVYVSDDETETTLSLRLTNPTLEPITGAGATEFRLSFAAGVQPSSSTLTTKDESQTVQVNPAPPCAASWQTSRDDLAGLPCWVLKPLHDPILPATESVEFRITGLVVPEPSGDVVLHLQYDGVPGYDPGTAHLVVPKLEPTAGLRIAYDIAPTPGTIHASPAAGKSTIDLHVVLTAPAAGVVLTRTEIDIPAGRAGPPFLSANPLPEPSFDQSIPWTITGGRDRVTIAPKTDGRLAGTITFDLHGIEVDRNEGGVAIAVTETIRDNPPVTVTNAYQLFKQRSRPAVVDFRADPPVLSDVDLPVELYWTATDPSDGIRYAIDPAPARPGPFTAQDGVDGVATAELQEEVNHITLAVRQDGATVSKYALDVPVKAPAVSPRSRWDQIGASRRFLGLRWLATDAAHCKLELAGTTTDHLPADTYHAPYPVAFTSAGQYQPVVTAYPAAGDVTDRAALNGPVTVSDPVSVAFTGARSIAITPDNQLALVARNQATGGLAVIELPTGTLRTVIPLSYALAVAVDGAGHVYVSSQGHALLPVDLRKGGTGQPILLDGAGGADGLAISPDGSVALTLGAKAVGHVDLRTRVVTPIAFEQPAGCAITPDGKLGLVLDSQAGTVTVLDLATGQPLPPAISIPRGCRCLAVSPDGATAFVSSYDENTGDTLLRLDIATRTMTGSQIYLPRTPFAVAISSLGYAVMVFGRDVQGKPGFVGVASLARDNPTAVLSGSWSAPYAVAVARDSSAVVIGGLWENVWVI